LPDPGPYPRVEVLDNAVETVPIEAMVKLGEEMITAVTNHTPGILCEAEVSKGVISVRILNSRGGQADYRKSFFSLSVQDGDGQGAPPA